MNKQKTTIFFIATFLLMGNLLCAQDAQIFDSITVTANKMEEDIKEIPQSITVMTDIEIEERGIKSIDDLIKYIPNLTTSYDSADRVNFRGINTSHYTNSNPIVIYIDGIPHSDMYGFDKAISNVLRVEVLRGPQGTIYGKDSMGGVINIITKEPSDIVEGSVLAEYGTDNYKEAVFNLSGPLIDNKLFLGVNGAFSQSDGSATNHYPGSRKDANEKERYLLNANLKYNPTDDLSIKLNINNDKNDKYGRKVGGSVPSGADINSYERDDFENVSYDEDTYTKTNSNSQALHVDYDFNNITFSSLTIHSKTDTDLSTDLGLSDDILREGLSVFREDEIRNISQEFRLSNDNDMFKWIAGLYYENNKMDIDRFGTTFPGSNIGNPFGEGVNVEMNAASETKSDTIAFFGQVVISFLDDYELALGGRYQEIKKDINLNYYMLPIGATGSPANTFDDEHTWHTFLPKVALSYKINSDLTSYFSITKGYLAGGYNTYASSGTAEQNRFDAQKSTNYELGIRGNLLDNKLYLSAAIFYMDIKNLQVNSFDEETSISHTSNAGEAYSQGVELELGYRINDNWSIDGSLGFIEAKYDEYTNAIGEDLKNNKIQKSPSHTANIGVSYLNNGFYGRFDIRNQGKIYFDEINTQKENSYTTANIKAGYLFDDWDIYAYANNITDESYLTAVNGTTVIFGEGRFVGIGVKYIF